MIRYIEWDIGHRIIERNKPKEGQNEEQRTGVTLVIALLY